MSGGAIVAVGPVRLAWESPDATFSPEHEHLVAQTWRDALERQPTLFDGRVLVTPKHRVDENGDISVSGRFSRYRYVLAQRHADLGIQTIGVTGISIVAEDGVSYALVGRRSLDVTDYPGRLELVPSGGVADKFAKPDHEVDYAGQIAEEFVEETGLAASAIASILGFALLFDESAQTFDIACRITLKPEIDRGAVAAAFAGAREYDGDAQFVPLAELNAFAAQHHEALVPASITLIEAASRLNEQEHRGTERI